MTYCYVCPHRCGVDRPESIHDATGTFGSCGVGMLPMVSRAAPHLWEEPVISGTDGKGSGAVFFTGCNLHCVFCQNYDITSRMIGKEISVGRLKEIYRELIDKGVHNINLVTPTHFTEAVLQSLDEPLPVPVVYNTSGFETIDTLRRLEGKVQIWLPDLKWSDDQAAIKYSNAWNYWQIARDAILEMYRQVGPYEIGDDGLLRKGVLIRHLIMPGFVETARPSSIGWPKLSNRGKSCSVSCTSTSPAATRPNTPKSTGKFPTRNTGKSRITCSPAASKTALSRKAKRPAATLSPRGT